MLVAEDHISKTYNDNNTDTQRMEQIHQLSTNEIIDKKHSKYESSYVAKDVYYGLGIENETYLMSDKFLNKTGDWLLKNHSRERYSIDYWNNFRKDSVKESLKIINPSKTYKIPTFINSYTLRNCDKNLQHATLYRSIRVPNAKFDGKSIHNLLMDKSEYYHDNYEKKFVYDGDTFEFTTLDFYKTTVNDCVKQLIDYKKEFIDEINKVFIENDILKNQYDKKICYGDNFGMVNFVTNPDNVAICNNSTYHINITLPTKLNEQRKIKNITKFRNKHANAIRGIQWIEPLLIACYGSPDIFSTTHDKFAKGSLRLALSRYIGAGTYDTEDMMAGKLLRCYEYDPDLDLDEMTVISIITSEVTNTRHINKYADIKDHWYKRYHKNSGYISQPAIGFDINYQKHYNHGIEIRFFDSFPEEYLKDVINILLLVCQFSLSYHIENPMMSKAYDDQMIESIQNGSACNVIQEYVIELAKIFKSDKLILNTTSNINNTINNSINVDIVYIFQTFVDNMYERLNKKSFISKISPNMQKPIVTNFNKIMFTKNRNFLYYGDYYDQYDYNEHNNDIHTNDISIDIINTNSNMKIQKVKNVEKIEKTGKNNKSLKNKLSDNVCSVQ